MGKNRNPTIQPEKSAEYHINDTTTTNNNSNATATMHQSPRRQSSSSRKSSSSPSSGSPVRVSRRDMIKQKIDFLRDDPSNMTYARRAALHLMTRHRWYNPQLLGGQDDDDDNDNDDDNDDDASIIGTNYIEMDDIIRDTSNNTSKTKTNGNTYSAYNNNNNKDDDVNDDDISCESFNRSMLQLPTKPKRPSLAKAWAYFEHVTLPRYLDHSASSASRTNTTNTTTTTSTTTTTTQRTQQQHDNDGEIISGAQYENSENNIAEPPATAARNETTTTSGGTQRGSGILPREIGRATRMGRARYEKRNHLLSNWATPTQHRQHRQREHHRREHAPKRQHHRTRGTRKETPPTAPPSKRKSNAVAAFFDEWLFYTGDNERGGDMFVVDLAEPGENRYPTKLYSPLWTPMDQMGDFGLGVGLCEFRERESVGCFACVDIYICILYIYRVLCVFSLYFFCSFGVGTVYLDLNCEEKEGCGCVYCLLFDGSLLIYIRVWRTKVFWVLMVRQSYYIGGRFVDCLCLFGFGFLA